MKTKVFQTVLAFLLLGSLGRETWANSSLKAPVLEPLPAWAADTLYSGAFLNIDEVMKAHDLTRFAAVEVQNRMRDLQDQNSKLTVQSAFEQALSEVKSGKIESGWTPMNFKNNEEFVVALDMDETLLMQWYASAKEGFFDIKDLLPDLVGKYASVGAVKFTPFAESFIRRLKQNPDCIGVVIYSAKLDAAALDIAQKWKFSDGRYLRDWVDGFFARNHLVLGPKALLPSKDLRILDPELKHVVLVDDNPGRVLQPQLLRAQPKFDADAYFKAKQSHNQEIIGHYENLLQPTYLEIAETSKAARTLGISFAQAFTPYSYAGERVYRSMTRALNSEQKAKQALRKEPKLLEAAFVFKNQ